MPLYENVFIARQDISGAQVDALTDGFVQLVADNGGEVKKREYWGLRNLAYRMRKNRKGHYVLMNVDAPAPAIAELERTMRINEDVLRYLTIRVAAHEEGPSAVMQNRGSREDRGRRGDGIGIGIGTDMAMDVTVANALIASPSRQSPKQWSPKWKPRHPALRVAAVRHGGRSFGAANLVHSPARTRPKSITRM